MVAKLDKVLGREGANLGSQWPRLRLRTPQLRTRTNTEKCEPLLRQSADEKLQAAVVAFGEVLGGAEWLLSLV